MAKTKKPVRRAAPAKKCAPKKSVKRKPIPTQVADGALRHNPRAVAFKPKHPTVEEQFQAEARALPEAPQPKPSLWRRFRSAITGRWVSRLFAKAHADTTVSEKVRK
ncbi:hypothetical protein LJB71_08315 [Thermomonas sp. S9]|uniref:hypothetical protein n=1 Tax=Thermomonas sp. S9 TaxID=2885203 RepID=UPI00216AE864|nr:hypothetical protein [Thermomonas sp. S9]MCR6496219.1 hypothetical protein [Thermomonas sp. S9]